jgi:hypothetical protein
MISDRVRRSSFCIRPSSAAIAGGSEIVNMTVSRGIQPLWANHETPKRPENMPWRHEASSNPVRVEGKPSEAGTQKNQANAEFSRSV